MARKLFPLVVLMLLLSPGWASSSEEDSSSPKIWLTVNARRQYLEVSWQNAPVQEGDHVVVTKQDPTSLEKRILASVVGKEDSVDVVATIEPSSSEQWFTTTEHFDYSLSRDVTVETTCYGYWASYVDAEGRILAKTCLRAYPLWMNELKSSIGQKRLRDLIIPGTHDAGAYKTNFNAPNDQTIENKYVLCQDDDIKGQLMHGARYLDMRVSYYKLSREKFFINHGIIRLRTLKEVIKQVKEFVEETNEIVIFGIKEFPVGFGDGLDVHHRLVKYLREQFGDMIADPSTSWSASLDDIWASKKNIILAYDEGPVVELYPDLLFPSVHQRWGDKRKWADLEKYLIEVNENDADRSSDRPQADMAELTPTTFDVVADRLGGLRKMADDVNWRISKLYRDDLANSANIIAADFIRGTTLMDLALEHNRR